MVHAQYRNRSTNSRMSMPQQDDPAQNSNDSTLWKLVLLSALAYLVWSDKVAIVINPVGEARPVAQQTSGHSTGKTHASLLPTITPEPPQRRKITGVELPANALGNLTLAIDPGFCERNGIDEREGLSGLKVCQEYVARFAPVAIAEMEKYGIPASITLAQGLLESNAGTSKLSRNCNNHFGIKCFSQKCKKGHCQNFQDDSHKDFFVQYPNVWSSYRAHSKFLHNGKRYKSLFNLPADDYRSWARGLAKAGYATDKHYAEKLIAVIHNLELDRFDHSRTP